MDWAQRLKKFINENEEKVQYLLSNSNLPRNNRNIKYIINNFNENKD